METSDTNNKDGHSKFSFHEQRSLKHTIIFVSFDMEHNIET